MVIRYCEKCGARIFESDLAEGSAKSLDGNRALCEQCAPKVFPERSPRTPGHSSLRPRPPSEARRSGSRTGAGSTHSSAARGMPKALIVVAVVAGGMILFGLAALLLSGPASRGQPSARGPESAPPTPSQPAAPATSPSSAPPQPEREPTPAVTPEFNPREVAATTALERARQFRKETPDDPWGYRDRLREVVRDHRNTPAGAQADQLLKELSLPTPEPPDLMELLDEKRWTKALSLLEPPPDPALDGVKGRWEIQGADLVNPERCDGARIAIPYVPPEEYDLRLEFTRTDGMDAVGLKFNHPCGNCVLILGSFGNRRAGFSIVDGRREAEIPERIGRQDWVLTGQRHTLALRVRRDALMACLDGKRVAELKTAGRRLSVNADFAPPVDRPDWLVLGNWASPTRYHRLQVLEVTGQGCRPERPKVPAAAAPPKAP
jgi:hypothetical protein